MRLLLSVAAAALWLVAHGASADQWNFDRAPAGQLPDGFSAAKTGTGPGSVWKIVEDPTAPSGGRALGQVSSEGGKRLFNLCVAAAPQPADLELSVALKAVRGKTDQGGGPVWRYQDENNYYVCRLNPLEFNFRVYKVIGGKRTQLATADVAPPEGSETLAGRWHAIRVVQQGPKVRCWLDGKLLLQADDAAIAQPGRVGLWTKADAVTSFDDLKAAPLTEK